MEFVWPEFKSVPLDGHRSWSATFDSFDQRTDDCYYVITLHAAERETARFMVRAGLGWVADGEWASPSFGSGLQGQLHALAIGGKSNTDYSGPVFRNS